MGLSIFGSESSSESTNTSQSAGFSEISGVASSLNLTTGKKSKNTTVNLVDNGAVAAAFDFAGQALKQVELAGANSRGSLQDAIGSVTESARSDSENVAVTLIKWGALAALVIFGLRALKG